MGRVVEGEYAGSGQIGPKGQVVLPVGVRRALDLGPGDRVLFYLRADKGHVKVLKADLVTALMNKTLDEITDLRNIMKQLKVKGGKS